MKKILACGLILSTLMSIGSVCFAIESGYSCSSWFTLSNGEKKAPRPPKQYEEEIEDEELRQAEQQFQALRNQAIALLSGYYEEGYGVIWYTKFELADMIIEDLSEDCTVLKVADIEKFLPPVVSETLAQYLALRNDIYPETMMENQPLFISNAYGRQTERISRMNVSFCAKKGRKQLDLTFCDVTEVRSTITKLKEEAIFYLYGYFQEKKIKYILEKLSKLKLGDIVRLQRSLILDSESIKLPKDVWAVLREYLKCREQYFPETMNSELPLFVNTKNPKQALPVTAGAVQGSIKRYRESSVCFAGRDVVVLDDDSETETDYHFIEDESEDGYDRIVKESQDYKETKKPRKPRKDKEERSAIKPKDRKELTNLRNQAMYLLSNYYEEGYRALAHSCGAIADMKISNLNEDCTILTVNGVPKDLPACVVEAIIAYLAKRAALASTTMGAEKPLFVNTTNPKQAAPLTAAAVRNSIYQYRQANYQPAYMEE